MNMADAYDVIISPVITEKSTRSSANNQVVFKVRKTATKPQIKQAVEQLCHFGIMATMLKRVCRQRA